jgi:Flp pilus assembly protein TadD
VLRWIAVFLTAATLFAADHRTEGASTGGIELRGRLDGEARSRWLQVTIFGVESPYKDSAPVSPGGEFRFRSLSPGDYTIAVVGEGWEIRRTVVVSEALADRDRIIRSTIPITLSGASGNGNGIVSVQELMIPKKASALYADAQKRLAERDSEGAVRALEQAVALAPEFPAAWNGLGVIAFQSGEDLEAERLFRRALQADPGSFEAAVNLGGVLLKKGWNREALVYNTIAVQTRPEDALSNAQLGMTHFQHGDYDLAEPYLVAAKKLDPAHFTEPQLFLAEIYARRGDRSGAIRELEDLLAHRPGGASSETIRRELEKLKSGK